MHIYDENEQVVKRITVTLEDDTHAALQEWADDEARSVPNLMAYLALKAVKERSQQMEKEKQDGRSRHAK
jgi:hypothetical protein